jgi:hypothetical protein
MVTVYDQQFNMNEWFIIIGLILSYTAYFLLPRRFPLSMTIIFFMFGIFIGTIFDHTISVGPFDFYDVNDNSLFNFMDFLTYILYGPIAYFFVYFIDRYALKNYQLIIYILVWSLIAIVVESLGVIVGVFHYKNGYEIYYSFIIYLFIQSFNVYVYKVLYKK